MRAKFINEKFTEKSDPIEDLGIGGFVPQKLYDEMIKPYHEAWRKSLNDMMVGKIVKGRFIRLDSFGEHAEKTKKDFPILVTKIIYAFPESGNITIKGPSGWEFELILEEKYKIEEYKDKAV